MAFQSFNDDPIARRAIDFVQAWYMGMLDEVGALYRSNDDKTPR